MIVSNYLTFADRFPAVSPKSVHATVIGGMLTIQQPETLQAKNQCPLALEERKLVTWMERTEFKGIVEDYCNTSHFHGVTNKREVLRRMSEIAASPSIKTQRQILEAINWIKNGKKDY